LNIQLKKNADKTAMNWRPVNPSTFSLKQEA